MIETISKTRFDFFFGENSRFWVVLPCFSNFASHPLEFW